MLFRILCATALSLFSFWPTSTLAAQPETRSKRPYTLDDMFALEGVGWYFGGPYAFSADGRAVAFTRLRPAASTANIKWEFLWRNATGDIWIQDGSAAQPVNITNGARDGSGWWAPQWAPDSQHIAMLSTRGGNVSLWSWDARTHRLRKRSKRAVDIDTQDIHQRPFVWLDARHVLYPALAEGQQPQSMRIELQTPQIATREWPKVVAGQLSTANVLDSGVPVDMSKRPHGQLRMLDVATGDDSVLVDANVSELHLAPGGEMVALLKQTGIYLPHADEATDFSLPGTFSAAVLTRDGKEVQLAGESSSDVLRDSIRWSPDGTAFIYLGYLAADHRLAPVLYRVSLADHVVTHETLGSLDAASLVRESPKLDWTANGKVIVYAAMREGRSHPDATARRDWWLIGADGTKKCLTRNLPEVPGELWPDASHDAFVGLANGKLWRIHSDGKAEDLTVGFKSEITQLLWPAVTNTGIEEWPIEGRTYPSLIVAARETDGKTLEYQLETNSGLLRPIFVPAPGAELKAYDPKTATGIFHRNDSDGLLVWSRDLRTGRTSELINANGFLRNIAEGEFKSIHYTSLDGQPLTAWLLLPSSYEKGKHYPLLTSVYAGSVAGATPSFASRIGFNSALNMQIPAARGYAVLMPSMPLAPEGNTDDPMLRLQNGVLPAVDQVIAQGYADSSRVFLMGQSFGGFSTYGLVTQTNRFTAAVALAGPSDLVSLYGQFDARYRYTQYPQESLLMAQLMESAQLRLGNPPWKDMGRYLRNSPIFYVDRVATPLMIMQGDIDYVALQQGEEFFNSLYRQGKRARFIRYWGEGHVLVSPANIRDMWERIFGWFDEFSPHP